MMQQDSNASFATAPQAVLIVDDDPGMRVLLSGLLRDHGFDVAAAQDYEEMARELERREIGLILLDIMLPGVGGFDICKEVRAGGWGDIPIIMISARGDEADQVAGLELGADDYIAKPFGKSELLARIRAVLRRPLLANALRPAKSSVVRFAGWAMDLRRRELLSPSGAAVTLSAAEYDLLANLVEHPQQIVARERLLELSRHRLSGSSDRSIDVLVSRLRSKLRGVDGPQIVKTVRGFGYMFAVEVERA